MIFDLIFVSEPAKLNDYDLIYKAIVIGESHVGKTALIRKYQNPDKELPNLLPTIGKYCLFWRIW